MPEKCFGHPYSCRKCAQCEYWLECYMEFKSPPTIKLVNYDCSTTEVPGWVDEVVNKFSQAELYRTAVSGIWGPSPVKTYEEEKK